MSELKCPLGGDESNDCEDCAYSSDYHFVDGDCVVREKQNIFFLSDIDENNIDAVIISSTSTKSDIEKAIHNVKLSVEDYTLDNIIENLPSDCKLYHRWSSETVYY